MTDIVLSIGAADNLGRITATRTLPWSDYVVSLLAPPVETSDKAGSGWIIPAEFSADVRREDTFVARYALTLDYDQITKADVGVIQAAFARWEHVVYTTASHTAEQPRLRVVMPLSRPVGLVEFGAVSRKVAAAAGINLASRESHVATQMMFAPTRKPGSKWRAHHQTGEILDVDEILASYANWENRAEWPARDGDTPPSGEPAQRPTEKPGLIGAFCRTYTVPEAIEKFGLPYAPTTNPNRWTYTLGSRPEGVIIYDDGLKLHSHHDTDPARGQHNAWDLVRLHKFAEQDAGVLPDAPPQERPSHKAMAALAEQDPAVLNCVAVEDFDILPDLPRSERSRFAVVHPREFVTRPPLEWWVKGVLPKAELAVVFGESGSGKSFWVLDLVAALQRGEDWRGLRTAQGRTVMVVAEGVGGFRSRLEAYTREHGADMDDMPGVIPDAPNLLALDDTDALIRAVLAWGRTGLVVIDTLSAASPGANENAGEDMGKVVNHCKRLHRATETAWGEGNGAMVVLIHHSGKDSSKGARGWSGLRAAADVEIEVTRSARERCATVTKLKDGADGAEFLFKLKPVALGVDRDGDVIESCVVEHVTPDEKEVKARPRTVRGRLARQVYDVATEYMIDGESLAVEFLLDRVVERLPLDSTAKRDRRRIAARRALQQLLDDKFLYLPDPTTVTLTRSVAGSPSEFQS